MEITGAQKLIDVYGVWPSFHDAEVVRFSLYRAGTGEAFGPTAECTIHLWQMTKEVDENRYYILKNHTLVTLRFIEVSESEFTGFNQQNALSALHIWDITSHQLERVKYEVSLPSSFGFEGSLKCLNVEVVAVVRCDPEGRPTSG